MHSVNGTTKLSLNRLCFLQAEDGRVVKVSYPKSEGMEVANVKKGIVSAFQANLRKKRREWKEMPQVVIWRDTSEGD